MLPRENMMTLLCDLNSDMAYSMATANVHYYGNQAEMNLTGEGQNPSLFSGSISVQRQLSADSSLNSMMVEELLNPVCFNNQALLQPLPTAFRSTLHNKYQYNVPSQQSPNVFDPALAPLPASARVTSNPIMACIKNNVASLKASNGDPDDLISFEEFLVDFRVVQPTPRIPPSALSIAVTAARIPTPDHNQIIRTQGQHFPLQTCMSRLGSNAASASEVIQMPKRRRGSIPEEAMNRKMQKMIKNRDSAARSRARKLALVLQLQTEIDELRKENINLKKMLEDKTEIKSGDEKLRRPIAGHKG